MKAAVVGPLCRDSNVIGGKCYQATGGVTYYAGTALARLGAETVVFASCGENSPVWPEEKRLRVVKIPAAGTLEFINEYDSADQRRQRTVVCDNRISPDQIDEHDLAGVDFIIAGPLLAGDLSLPLVKYLARFGRLALAAQGLIRYAGREGIEWKKAEKVLKFLPWFEYVALDEAELRFIGGRDDLDLAARTLQDAGAANLIVTRGGAGSVLFLGGERYRIPAFPPLRLADPTGAGDTYLAGYLRALELFDDPAERGNFAAMAATLSLESHGPFAGSLEELRRRLGRL